MRLKWGRMLSKPGKENHIAVKGIDRRGDEEM